VAGAECDAAAAHIADAVPSSNTLITPSEYYRALLAGSAYEASFMSWM
jgi:hypothetical protein